MLALPKPPRRKVTQSRHSTSKSKPGPVAFVPTDRQRHRVELAVATGVPLESIADGMEISRRTLCRAFVHELAVGKSKQLLASVVRLDKSAERGNVAAMKYLHVLMTSHADKTEAVEDDKWSALATKIEADLDAEANLPIKGEFWKNN